MQDDEDEEELDNDEEVKKIQKVDKPKKDEKKKIRTESGQDFMNVLSKIRENDLRRDRKEYMKRKNR